MEDPSELTATQLADGMAAGRFSSVEIVQALLGRCERARTLNAFSALDPQASLEAARQADQERSTGQIRGPLHGVPVTFKDNIAVLGLPNTAGTPFLRNFRPRRQASIASRVLASGAVALGKNVLHELAFGATSNNAAFGTVANPYDRQRIAGGSSGGTAAAVAARLAPVGIGTDTGGSVRVPAALCGVFGFRPSTGRWPTDGIVPISATRDTPGPLARSMQDLLMLDQVATGHEARAQLPALRDLRLGLPLRQWWERLDSDVAGQCTEAIVRLKAHGVTVVDVDLPQIPEFTRAISLVISLHEAGPALQAYLQEAGFANEALQACADSIASPDVRALFALMRDPETAITAAAYQRAVNELRPQLMAAYENAFAAQRLDALAFPTVPVTAPRIGEDASLLLEGKSAPTFQTLTRQTDSGSCAGLPGLTLPAGLGRRSALPVGLALDGRRGCDADLLALGRAVAPLFAAVPMPGGPRPQD